MEVFMKYFQQGDVLFFAVDGVKGTKKKADLRGIVFAEGEYTGHYHAIKETDTDDVELYEENGVLYCSVKKERATVEHQEHGAIVLPKGDYKIGIVKEFDPFEEEIRQVKD